MFSESKLRRRPVLCAVRDSEELLYIQDNMQYINRIIKKQNVKNEIIYIVSSSISGSDDVSFPFFVVKSSYEGNRIEEIRKLFDDEVKLLDFYKDNFDAKKRYKNMVFDLQKENRRIEYRYWMITKIEEIDFNKIKIPKEIIIYGAGTIGKAFYHKIKKICKVLFFMDGKPKEVCYDGIPVVQRNEMNNKYSDITIVITPCYEYQEIKDGLLDIYGELNIISLIDWLR